MSVLGCQGPNIVRLSIGKSSTALRVASIKKTGCGTFGGSGYEQTLDGRGGMRCVQKQLMLAYLANCHCIDNARLNWVQG